MCPKYVSRGLQTRSNGRKYFEFETAPQDCRDHDLIQKVEKVGPCNPGELSRRHNIFVNRAAFDAQPHEFKRFLTVKYMSIVLISNAALSCVLEHHLKIKIGTISYVCAVLPPRKSPLRVENAS
jgi:hypothetical protein